MQAHRDDLDLTPFLRVPFLRSDLTPATKVYRITDFFSVAQVLEQRRLHLTCMHSYSDVNEGVDRLVRALVLSADGGGCGPFGANDEASTKLQLEQERRGRFIGCWSKNPESHAMWAMYSPDRCSVRMQTTIGKLQEACGKAALASWSVLQDDPLFDLASTPFPMVVESTVLPVLYEDLHHLIGRLARRKRLAKRLVKSKRLFKEGQPPSFPRSMLKVQQKWDRYFKDGFLKDSAYAYEDEVRISVRLGWEPSLGDMREKLRQLGAMDEPLFAGGALDKLDAKAFVLQTRLRVTNDVKAELLPAHYAIPADIGFVESVCIDPRAAKHKADFMKQFFEGHGVAVQRSKSFDAAYLGLSAYPDDV
ncbi:MAG: hypothetical protein EOO32_05095 [Comamonadaceae bacterium]|nr:MAG: hypothetical protein EOO32_05095 [Comamonadaceae bacterium]